MGSSPPSWGRIDMDFLHLVRTAGGPRFLSEHRLAKPGKQCSDDHKVPPQRVMKVLRRSGRCPPNPVRLQSSGRPTGRLPPSHADHLQQPGSEGRAGLPGTPIEFQLSANNKHRKFQQLNSNTVAAKLQVTQPLGRLPPSDRRPWRHSPHPRECSQAPHAVQRPVRLLPAPAGMVTIPVFGQGGANLGFSLPPSGFAPETYALRDRERSCCPVPTTGNRFTRCREGAGSRPDLRP